MAEKICVTASRVWYWCPGCLTDHQISVDKWSWDGDLEKPTITPSVLINDDLACPNYPRCHHFVKDGKLEFLSDCTHDLVGQTVDMEDF